MHIAAERVIVGGRRMASLMPHLWSLGILVLLANVAIGRIRMRTLIARGVMTAAQANRFCVGAAIVFVIAGGLFGLAAWASGVPAPCQVTLPFADRRLWPSHAVSVLSGALLLYWIWRRGGDRTLALVAPAFTRGGVAEKTYSPRQVRTWVTALVVAGLITFLVIRIVMPVPPQFPGCGS